MVPESRSEVPASGLASGRRTGLLSESDRIGFARICVCSARVAGKIQAARQLIQRGCEECPKSEDVWLEVCRLASPDGAKAVIAAGVKSIPNSVRLWKAVVELVNE